MKPVTSETILEVAAAVWAGACTAIALWLLGPTTGFLSPLASLSGAVLAAVGTLRLLGQSRQSAFPIPAFDVPPIETNGLDELLLTDEVVKAAAAPTEELMLTLEQRLGAEREETIATNDELLLEDVLARIEPESRVIRLFDPAAMPTAGELHSRIDRHLQNREAPAFPDAAQALNDALADLRRSLR